jgi:biopolymer transport protein ExbD
VSQFSLRRAGTDSTRDGLSREAVARMVLDGRADLSDEVQGPADLDWTPIADHPEFAAEVEAIESLTVPDKVEEETHLDMNPLIDVSLVLLIFFILTATYEEMRKELPSPPPSKEKQVKGTQIVSPDDLNRMAVAVVILSGEEPTYRVSNQTVPASGLREALIAALKQSGLRRLSLEVQPKVPWKAVTGFQDAATGIGVEEILRVEK